MGSEMCIRDRAYEPDFVAETTNEKLMCEVKSSAELDDPVVRAKAAAAATWCRSAMHESALLLSFWLAIYRRR